MTNRPSGGTPRRRGTVVAACLLLASAQAVARDETAGRLEIGLETGAVGISRNDARIPGDTGTDIDIAALTGSGPRPYARLGAHWHIDDRHSLHVVFAPLEINDTDRLNRATDFAGESFPAGRTEATYRFDAYKLTYRYTFADRGRWRWGVGFTGLVRDAEIELRQGASRASDDDVGFVPALHVHGRYRLGDRWAFELDADGLAGGPGRLIDLALTLEHELGRRWQVGAGYRTLEGGADTDDVFNFAWLNYALIEARYRF